LPQLTLCTLTNIQEPGGTDHIVPVPRSTQEAYLLLEAAHADRGIILARNSLTRQIIHHNTLVLQYNRMVLEQAQDDLHATDRFVATSLTNKYASCPLSPTHPPSPSEQESDVEDEQFCVPAILQATQGKPLGIKIPAFCSFMREIYHNTVLHSPVISDVVPDEPLEDAPGSLPSADAIIHPSPVVVVCEPPLHSHSPINF
jgi:hypothetical protein